MTTTERSGTRAAARTLPPIAERDLTEVLWEQTDEGVLAITLNRPERLNALSFRLLREVQQLIDHAAATPEVRVVTLRGAGERAFCSGDDLKGMNPEPGYDSSETVHQPLLLSIRELPNPVVALVTGYALGHGWELASACDMRLVADNCEVGDHRVQRSIAMERRDLLVRAATGWARPSAGAVDDGPPPQLRGGGRLGLGEPRLAARRIRRALCGVRLDARAVADDRRRCLQGSGRLLRGTQPP